MSQAYIGIYRSSKNNMIRGDRLGEGTFGIVYSARSPRTNTQYAVKRNISEKDTSFIGVARETDILNKLRNHPHIVRIEHVAFGEPFNSGCFSPLMGKDRTSQKDDSIHFVFKQAAYDLHRFIYGAVEVDFALIKRYMVNILLGTEYIHYQKIIHRDLKPSNVLIFGEEKDVAGISNVAKICDFGLAKPYTHQGKQTPSVVTSWYRAPEIALGYPDYDYKTDIWSLGCILYEMVARRAFISGSPDTDDDVLSYILGSLPEELPLRQLRQLVKSNKWRTIILRPIHSPRFRRTFYQQLGLSDEGIIKFEKNAGKLSDFCDLLNNMLKFDWTERYTAKQCLDHVFFNDYGDLINETRRRYNLQTRHHRLEVCDCIERRWMAQIVTQIFNNRHRLKWYNTRAVFQAMDLFDRYLFVMFRTADIHPSMVESDLKGLIHDKHGTELHFMTCVYLCIKYFSSIHYPISYEEIVGHDLRTSDSKLIAERFEGGFIKNCLEYNIYRPTIYEAADEFNDKLGETEIRDLIILYSMNSSFSGMTCPELYSYYRENLRGHPIEKLFSPVKQSQTI